MAKKLGKVVEQVNGFRVRIMLESKSVEKIGRDDKIVKRSFMGDSGKFGVYVGNKNLLKGDFKNKKEAVDFIKSK